MYYNLINIIGLRPRHGNEKCSTHDSDRSCEEGSVRKTVRGAGLDALTGRAATDPRLPRSAWCQLPDQKRNWRTSAPKNRLKYTCATSATGSRAGIAPGPGSTTLQVSLRIVADKIRDLHLIARKPRMASRVKGGVAQSCGHAVCQKAIHQNHAWARIVALDDVFRAVRADYFESPVIGRNMFRQTARPYQGIRIRCGGSTCYQSTCTRIRSGHRAVNA
ncbi:hypothetical protein SAMN05192564_1094 [Paraburkholderia sartisoli]|uniref:Uncharacterized protein n=1 Tax=Paraburkholderia sartisoli TaxID=83784 RepID=A0A1H4HIP9_9BURK|nr:hypothetical protein SAMN05192564_1094 [Paraburkholderia sartisoli]